MRVPELIYCAGKNKRFGDVALEAGYKLGAQLPCTVYHSVYFADQNWKKPNRAAYMRALAQHKPTMATVLDWERDDQLPEVLDWSEEAAQYAEFVLIIPKVSQGIKRLPRKIGGKDVVLAFSVPTQFGGTLLSPNQFTGWNVHLLGGSPQAQMKLWRGWFGNICNVVSVDGNYHQMKATRFCQYFQSGKWVADNHQTEYDAPFECFKKSCQNIKQAWELIGAN